MKEDINALDEMNKGASMGMDAIDFIMDKVDDKAFLRVLKCEYDKYKKMVDRIGKVYKKYNDDDTPHETSTMTKAMTWWGIEMKTFNDRSNSKIAELLLNGTNMGIIEGRKILNNKELDKEVSRIADEYVRMQEENVEVLKKYL